MRCSDIGRHNVGRHHHHSDLGLPRRWSWGGIRGKLDVSRPLREGERIYRRGYNTCIDQVSYYWTFDTVPTYDELSRISPFMALTNDTLRVRSRDPYHQD